MCINKIFVFLSLVLLISSSPINYSTSIASKLVKLSEATYQKDKAILDSWKCPTCDQNLKHPKIIEFKDQKMRAIVAYDDASNSVFLAFKGTNINLNNIKTDIKIQLCSYQLCQNCQVHRGFLDLYKIMSQTIEQEVRARLSQKYGRLFITGHSLGGALANLAAFNLSRQLKLKREQVFVYTYGQPRVGNKQFTIYYSNEIPNHYRVVYQNDIVTNLPIMISGYLHSGFEIWYKDSEFSSYEICIGENPKCSLTKCFIFRPPSIQNHHLKNYLSLKILSEQQQKTQILHQDQSCFEKEKNQEKEYVQKYLNDLKDPTKNIPQEDIQGANLQITNDDPDTQDEQRQEF